MSDDSSDESVSSRSDKSTSSILCGSSFNLAILIGEKMGFAGCQILRVVELKEGSVIVSDILEESS